MSAIARKEAARRRSVRTGLIAAAGAVAITLFAVTAQNGLPDYLPGVSRSSVDAVFTDAGALRAGDDVRIADVRAGFVRSIDLSNGQAVVHMELDGGRQVYDDASATIGARSALGQKFVELDPGTPADGPLAAPIPASRTKPAVELDEALSALDARTRTALASTLRQVGGGMGGRGRDLNAGLAAAPDLLHDLDRISTALADGHGQRLSELLSTAATLGESLSGQRRSIAGMTRQLATTLDAVGTDQGDPLGRTLDQSGPTLVAARHALDTLNGPLADTGTAARALRPGARSLARALPDTRALLREAVQPLDLLPGVAGQAGTAVDDLTPTLASATPVVRSLGTALSQARSPLQTLAPYSQEVLLFFQNAASALGQHDSAGGWLRFYPVLNAESVIGNVPIRSPLSHREAYPAPGEAATHRTNQLQVTR
ncbi:MAG TPA: MlaD family protein [Nocardioides sp.]|nr:MlaD family protein [Nocardioides sp.]